MHRFFINLWLMLAWGTCGATTADFSAVNDSIDRYRSGQSELRITLDARGFRVLEGRSADLSATDLSRLEQPVLALESSGIEVAWVQEALKRTGHFASELTGTYGPATEQAVKAFQRQNALQADGKVGRTTWVALNLPNERRPAWKEIGNTTVTQDVRRTRYSIDANLDVEAIQSSTGTTSWKKIPFLPVGSYPRNSWIHFLEWSVGKGLLSVAISSIEDRQRAVLTFRGNDLPDLASLVLSAEAQRLLKISKKYPPHTPGGKRLVILIHEPHSDVAGHLQLLDGLHELKQSNPTLALKFLVEGDRPDASRTTARGVAPEIPLMPLAALLSSEQSQRHQQVYYLLRNYLIDNPLAYRLLYEPVPAVAIDDQDALDKTPPSALFSRADSFRQLQQLAKKLGADHPRSLNALDKLEVLLRQFFINSDDPRQLVQWDADTAAAVRAVEQAVVAMGGARYEKEAKFLRKLADDLDVERNIGKLALVRDATMATHIRNHFTGPDSARTPMAFIGNFHTPGIIDLLQRDYGYVVIEPRIITHQLDEAARFNDTLHDYSKGTAAAMRSLRKQVTFPPQSALPALREITHQVAAASTQRYALNGDFLDAQSVAAIREAVDQNGSFNMAQVNFGGGGMKPPRNYESAFASFTPPSGGSGGIGIMKSSNTSDGSGGELRLLPGPTREWDDNARATWHAQDRLDFLRSALLLPPHQSQQGDREIRQGTFWQHPGTQRIFSVIFEPEQKTYYFFSSDKGLQGMEALLTPAPDKPIDIHTIVTEIIERLRTANS